MHLGLKWQNMFFYSAFSPCFTEDYILVLIKYVRFIVTYMKLNKATNVNSYDYEERIS